jgi:hypothetical protein
MNSMFEPDGPHQSIGKMGNSGELRKKTWLPFKVFFPRTFSRRALSRRRHRRAAGNPGIEQQSVEPLQS